MRNREELLRAVLLTALLIVSLFLGKKLLSMVERDSGKGVQNFLAQAYVQAGEKAVEVFLPGIFYEEKEEDVFLRLLERVREEFPVLHWFEARQPSKTEDEETKERILAENAERIAKEQTIENENRQAREEGGNTEANGGGTAEAPPPNGGGTAETPLPNGAGTAETPLPNGAETAETSPPNGGGTAEAPPPNGAGTAETPPPNGGGTAETLSSQPTAAQVPEGTATQKLYEIPTEHVRDFGSILKNFFVVDPNTTALSSQINFDTLMGKDLRMDCVPQKPQILIYHTHSQEGFRDSVAGDPRTTVIGVGDYLAQLLTQRYGYQVLHVTDTFDIVNGKLDRSEAYTYAEPVIAQKLQENPSIEIVIDLHRDGVDESKHLVTEINGKQTAKIMFFNGMSRTNQNGEIAYLPNPYIQDNLAFSFQLEYLAKQYYPGYTRCIYLKGYRYNLHLRPRALLLEVGAQTNTVEEAKNAMEPFADLLWKVLSGNT